MYHIFDSDNDYDYGNLNMLPEEKEDTFFNFDEFFTLTPQSPWIPETKLDTDPINLTKPVASISKIQQGQSITKL